MAIEIEKETAVTVTASDFVDRLDLDDIGDLICQVAEKFDREFKDRNWLAQQFAECLTENGARFMAEVVTQHYARNR